MSSGVETKELPLTWKGGGEATKAVSLNLISIFLKMMQ